MLNNQFFILFANCIPVKGYRRSIICDLIRNKFYFIPNELFKIITEYKTQTIGDIKKRYESKFQKIIDEYFHFLLDKQLIILLKTKDELKSFPRLDLSWDDSCLISNAVIEIDINTNIEVNHIISQLKDISCKSLQIKIVSRVEIFYIKEMLKSLENSTITYIELVFSNLLFEIEEVKNLFNEFPRLYNCYVFNSDSFKIIPIQESSNIVFLRENLVNNKSCGFIHPNNFTVNIDFFLESINCNSCLNRKVAIDKYGNIKNCLVMDKTYGNINTFFIKDIVQTNEFKRLWNLNKDKIKVCKDCEFRYVCLDCRGIIEDNNDIYSKPLNCSYNPYKAEGF